MLDKEVTERNVSENKLVSKIRKVVACLTVK